LIGLAGDVRKYDAWTALLVRHREKAVENLARTKHRFISQSFKGEKYDYYERSRGLPLLSLLTYATT